ncbi:kinase-like protein [Lichtheimia hyalospora FSU 10163]|nr:kinase-like protein [Lichtheimia hyalospora FSU 10163]
MTTTFSIRKTTAAAASHKCKYIKPRAIQSSAALPLHTSLPPSPPHKQQQIQQHHTASSIDSTLSTNSRDVIVGDQWLVLSRIGEGSFGEVFEAEDIETHRHYAIKREPLDTPFSQLRHESIMYDVLAGGPGIPQCQWYGEHDDFACIVIDLLGSSLSQLRETVAYMNIDTVVDLGCQMVTILEHIHNQGVVYRDVKPDNFLFPSNCHLPTTTSVASCADIFDTNNIPRLSVVDFGLATWWRNPQTHKPYPQSKRRIKHKTGTARYASLNVHRGKVHARRDDLESLGYLLLDLLIGTLPWTGIQAKSSKAGWDRMRELKESTDLTELCAGLPRGLLEFVAYTRTLHFADTPDYDYLRRMLRESIGQGELAKSVPEKPLSPHHHVKGGTMSTTATEEGVFVMDDLAHELSAVDIQPPNNRQGRRRRRNSSNNHRKRSTSKGSLHHNTSKRSNAQTTTTPPSPPSPCSISATGAGGSNKHQQTNRKKHGGPLVGWNTHKSSRVATTMARTTLDEETTAVDDEWNKMMIWGEKQAWGQQDQRQPPPWL